MTSSPQSLPSTGVLRAAFETASHAFSAGRGRSDARATEAPKAANHIEAAIAEAAARTKVDFGFLLAQAEVESAMIPDAKASSSSATGLYQFIETTWLQTSKKHGARFGLGDLAQKIDLSRSGNPIVAKPKDREALLAMRSDPKIASLMAAALAEENRAHLAPILGRQPNNAELYLAHFLGSGGASRFLSAMRSDPSQNAADQPQPIPQSFSGKAAKRAALPRS